MNRPASLKYGTCVWIVLVLAVSLFFFRLGDRSFRNPDEGRYAGIAREMVESHQWVEPRLYGIAYLSKPILFHWLVALSFVCFGFSEWAARFVPACFGIAGIGMAFWFCRKIFDESTAFWAGLLLATNLWYLEVGRYLVIDAVFSFFLTAAFYFFYLGCCRQEEDRRYVYGFYASVALSVLAKGLAGVVIPGFCLFLYLTVSGQWRKIFGRLRLVEGLLIFSVITVPWFAAISLREPGFLSSFFLHEHFSRFVSATYEHQEPWYYYLLILPALLLPWTIFFRPWKKIILFFKNNSLKSEALYLGIVLAGIVVFYSLSRSKLLTYMLPVIPFFAILLAKAWREWEAEEITQPCSKFSLILFATFILIAGSALGFPGMWQQAFKKLTPDLMIYFRGAAVCLLLMSAVSLFFLIKRRVVPLFYSLIAVSAVFSMLAACVMESQNFNYTTKPLAQALKSEIKAGDSVFIYDDPGVFYDFKFYLGWPVKLVGLEGELKKRKGHPDALSNTVTREEFFALLHGSGKVYCLIRKSDFQGMDAEIRDHVKIFKEDKRKVIFES